LHAQTVQALLNRCAFRLKRLLLLCLSAGDFVVKPIALNLRTWSQHCASVTYRPLFGSFAEDRTQCVGDCFARALVAYVGPDALGA
jgi:hypothetical protein